MIKNTESEAAIRELLSIRNKYLKDKYFKINWENAMADELNKMVWLKSFQVISEDEFEEVKKDIISK